MEAIKILSQAVIAVALLLLVLFGIQRIGTFLKYQAIDNCASAARSEFISDGNKTIIPVQEVYQQCLRDKGIKK